MYRVQQLSKRTVAMHWQRHKVGAAHWREMAERGETMPVCIAVGADPASMYSASAPLPPMVDEFIFAGFLRAVAGAAREGGDVRPRGAGGRGDRARGLHRPARGARGRRAVRRPHGLLLGGGPLPAGAPHRGDDAPRRDLRDDDRRPAADGGLLPRPRDRADLPAAAQADGSRDRRLPHAGGGGLSQPRVRVDRQAVSGAGLQGDERAVGRRA